MLYMTGSNPTPISGVEKIKAWFTTHNLLQNVIAGFTVSFIALSLGAAFGLLSGRGAFAGMISAALIAFFTSAFGGTRVQCSGPTGPMTAVTAVVVAAAHDSILAKFPGMVPDHFVNVVLLLTAVFLILMGVLRLGKFIAYVPNVVISGFMNGIAIIIWLDQLKKIFGLGGKTAYSGPLSMNLLVTIASVILVFTLPKFFKRFMPKFASLLSATFATIIIMTAAAAVFQLPIEHVQLTGAIRSWHDVTGLVAAQWPQTWSSALLLAAVPFALQLAILGYLDTLMTSLIVDKMTKEKTKQNKELVAQGVGAAAAALVGGIPGAQATIRSVLIVKEKATSRLAGILVGVLALIEMLLFQDLINLIPQAVFAGILIKVGYDVFDLPPVRIYLKEWFRNKSQMVHNFFSSETDEPIFVSNMEMFVILGATALTVFWDLNFAVGIFTLFFYLWNKVFFKHKPMHDLKPVVETEGMGEEL